MITFRRFTLGFFIILLGLNLWNILSGKNDGGFYHEHIAILYLALISVYLGVSFAMAFLPCSNFHHPVICSGKTGDKIVAITFDDGPDPVKTPPVIEILKKYNVQAAFFCIGKNIAGNESLLKRMHDGGHLLGNHSFTHSKWFDLFSAKKMRRELMDTDQLLAKVTGGSPLFFRPPFGVMNPMLSNALKKMPAKVVCWNIRSYDTMNTDAGIILKRILKRLKPGAVILVHDHSVFSALQLDELLAGIQNAGYRIVRLDKLIGEPAYGG